MISDLPEGFELYMEREGAPRLTGIVHRGLRLFDVFSPMAAGCRKGINLYHLLNYYNKYFAPHGIEKKDPFAILYAAKGEQSGELALTVAQMMRLQEVLPSLAPTDATFIHPICNMQYTVTVAWDEDAYIPLRIIHKGVSQPIDSYCFKESLTDRVPSTKGWDVRLLRHFYQGRETLFTLLAVGRPLKPSTATLHPIKL